MAKAAICSGIFIMPRPFQTLGVNYEFFLFEKFIGNINSGIQIAPPITSQVNNKLLHTFELKVVSGFFELIVGGGAETV
ncbi:MAG: hypothetical protein BWY70_01431 [Bacteroidetes bacterium ADurb.Bin408]|nr:MAG: hypothetical protein BWY70_01431 [Bacteroidetes bacterium ADurb.Bin408]